MANDGVANDGVGSERAGNRLSLEAFLDPAAFARLGGLRLRGYQQAVARAIVDSVLRQRGESFAVLFPRQSGKNELQAQIEALLLLAYSLRGGEIVKISPTWRPQSINAMRRLERVLDAHPATRGRWVKENGYIYRLNRARIFFLSGAPEANIVGATASLLLEVDEAQDVSLAKYDKEIAPMAASTNATRVFWGTAWTSQTLLAREIAESLAWTARDSEAVAAAEAATTAAAEEEMAAKAAEAASTAKAAADKAGVTVIAAPADVTAEVASAKADEAASTIHAAADKAGVTIQAAPANVISEAAAAKTTEAYATVEPRRGPASGRRAFVISADAVAAEVPAYGQFVAAQVARLGRQHPLVRTQFYSETIDEQTGMFPAERIARMRGDHPARRDPLPGRRYALLVDVGGESMGAAPVGSGELEAAPLDVAPLNGTPSSSGAVGFASPLHSPVEAAAPGDYAQRNRTSEHDATALTVVEVDLEPLADPARRAPVYRVMDRRTWTGVGQVELYAQIRALAEHWRACRVVVDATGVGAGLAAFLGRALPGRVTPFVFSSASKSRLGWDFLALVDAGRWQECLSESPEQADFFRQLACCASSILPGPGRRMQWGVPDGTRDPLSGQPVHDDLIISAALAAVLDGLDWPAPGSAGMGVVRAKDPLEDMRGF